MIIAAGCYPRRKGEEMKQIVFGLILTMLLLACATSQKYDAELKNWVGQSEASLIAAWGQPTGQKYLNNHSKIITYTRISDWLVPTEYYLDNDGWGAGEIVYDPYLTEYNFAPYSEIVDTTVQQICQTSFWIDNGIITAWKWRGNNCVAQ